MNNELYHHGTKGQKWGVRNYQNPDGTLTPAGRERYYKKTMRQDTKWIKKNEKKIQNFAKAQTKDVMNQYDRQVLRSQYSTRRTNGKLNSNYVNAYNKKLASLMNESIKGLETPNGRVVTFVAKRGEVGVYTAFADKGYDLSQVRNGVYASGKVAYRKEHVGTTAND